MFGFLRGAAIGCLRVISAIGMATLLMSCSEDRPAPAPESKPSPQTPTESAPPPVAQDDKARLDGFLAQKKFFSARKEELLVRHFFNDRRDGVFVDVGCSYWFRSSVTAYLETRLGWSGIAIDALPDLAQGWKKHRPRSKFNRYAITDTSGEELTFYVAGQLSSLNEDHLDQFKGMKDKFPKKEIIVTTITLNDLLEQNGVEKINFMNMDIEGGEPAALAGFDIKKYRPELVCIEAAPTIRASLTEYFAANDYERIDEYLAHDSVNWYYRPRP